MLNSKEYERLQEGLKSSHASSSIRTFWGLSYQTFQKPGQFIQSQIKSKNYLGSFNFYFLYSIAFSEANFETFQKKNSLTTTKLCNMCSKERCVVRKIEEQRGRKISRLNIELKQAWKISQSFEFQL